MSQINVSNLTFGYEGSYDNIFEKVSFIIDTDWKLGFTGRNARGKTTFLKLLMGEHEYNGKITASVSFEYFPYPVADKKCVTSDIIKEIHPNCALWQLKQELFLLEIEEEVLYRPFETLSHGEQTKVLLAVLFLKKNAFLLIDEATNHLDNHGRNIVAKYLNSKKGFILVSHDRQFLDNCTDHTLAINKRNIQIEKGSFSSWYNNKQQQDNWEDTQKANLQRDIKHLSTAAKATERWAQDVEKSKFGTKNSGSKLDKGYIGAKSAKMQKTKLRLEQRQKDAIYQKKGLLQNAETIDKLIMHPLMFHKNPIMSVNNFSVNYNGKEVCHDISFSLPQGSRLCIKGKNGSGKSSLLKAIMGENIPHNGTIEMNPQVKISYIPQDTSQLEGALTDFAKTYELNETLFKTNLRKLDFDRIQFEKDISGLSEGQKKKVLLAKGLSEEAHLYIWDEPLNYIDIFSRMQIENLLMEYSPTIIIVEHDETFIANIASYTIEL